MNTRIEKTGSKQLDRWIQQNPGVVTSAHREGRDYWIGLAGHLWCPEMDCGTIHETTVAEVLRLLGTVEGRPILVTTQVEVAEGEFEDITTEHRPAPSDWRQGSPGEVYRALARWLHFDAVMRALPDGALDDPCTLASYDGHTWIEAFENEVLTLTEHTGALWATDTIRWA